MEAVVRRLHPLVLALALAACGRTGLYDVPIGRGGDETQNTTREWVEIAGSATGGGVSQHGDVAGCDRVAVDAQGRVYFVWADASSGAGQIYLRRFDGSWGALAGSDVGSGISQNAAIPSGTNETCLGAIAFDASDAPYLAWQHVASSNQPIYVRYWDGAIWRDLGGSGSGNGISGTGDSWWPSMIVDDTGPVVAFERQTNGLVRRWSGSWVGVGDAGDAPGLSDVTGESYVASLGRDGQGRLLAAWTAVASSDYAIRAARFEAGAWTRLGGDVGTSATHYQPALLVARGDAVYVAWNDDDALTANVRVAKLDGTSWVTLPNPGPSGSRASLAIDSSNLPVLVWAQLDALGQNIHGARWNGSTWDSLDGAAGSISNAVLPAELPSVAVADDDTVYVSWIQDVGGGVSEVYAKALVTR